MWFGDYPTPGDARLYIGSAWVDDAYRVDFDYQNKKLPLWGYHQKSFADVADGKRIVVGNIIIHFRMPGYLTYAIKKVLDEREESELADSVTRGDGQTPGPAPGGPGGSQSQPARPSKPLLPGKAAFMETLHAMRRGTVEERAKLLASSFRLGSFDQMSSLMTSVYGSVIEGSQEEKRQFPLQNPADIRPQDYVQGQLGFDLTVYYGYFAGRQNKGIYLSEVLKGVHLTGQRKVINASTSGGDLSASGQSLLEVYPFFCREIEPIVTDAEQGPPFGG